jgi:hypothetical protein
MQPLMACTKTYLAAQFLRERICVRDLVFPLRHLPRFMRVAFNSPLVAETVPAVAAAGVVVADAAATAAAEGWAVHRLLSCSPPIWRRSEVFHSSSVARSWTRQAVLCRRTPEYLRITVSTPFFNFLRVI